MGNGCHHKHHHLHQQSFYNKNTFLPLLCRVSIKDVRLRDRKDRSASISEDPSSPRVSCMGQVKKSHQLIDFSTPYRLTMTTATSTAMIPSKPDSNRGHFRYTKLKRLFSGKNLPITTAAAATATATATASDGRSRSCREIIMRRNGSRRSSKINNDDSSESDQSCRHPEDDHVNLNISELDPPLPKKMDNREPATTV